jgi:hypothetical protein
MSMTTEIDMTKFCASEEGRYSFTKPFVRDGKRYATDGRICVRVDAAGEPNTEHGYDPVDEVLPKGTVRWVPWPAMEYVSRMDKCATCDGSKYVGRDECTACDGSGDCACACGDVHDCGKCNGKGYTGIGTPCPTCASKGEYIQPHHQLVSGKPIKVKYDAMIRTLPGVMYGPDTAKTGLLWIKFDGGDGAVMSVNV